MRKIYIGNFLEGSSMGDFKLFPVLLLLVLALVVGCQTTGQAFLGAGGEVLFDVQREVSGTDVTLTVTDNLVVQDTLVVVVERLPAGSTFSDGGFSLTPSVLNDEKTIAMWILSPGAQNLPQFSITGGIPASLTYTYAGGTLACSDIAGKYGVDEGTGDPFEDTVGCGSVTAGDGGTSSDGDQGASVSFAQFSQALTDYGNGAISFPVFSQTLTDYINSN